jgi:hypothetical protein
MLPTELIRHVIELAQAAKRERRAEEAKLYPPEQVYVLFPPNWRPGLTPGERTLRDYLLGLSEAELCMLYQLMYLGRDGFSVRAFQNLYLDMATNTPSKHDAALQLRKLQLPEYLEDGLASLTEAQPHVDQFLDQAIQKWNRLWSAKLRARALADRHQTAVEG